MSTHNIGFYEEILKCSLNYHNYHKISSNVHFISSYAHDIKFVFSGREINLY